MEAVGASDYYYGDGTTATTTSLNLNPGITYYARVWTFCNSVWAWSDSVFSTSATSYLTSPANGATASPQQAVLSWAAVPGPVVYTLWLGTAPGGRDVLALTSSDISTTVSDLRPGAMYYATL